jgi:hypothetical protein
MKVFRISALFSALVISGIHCGQGHSQTTSDAGTENPDKVTLAIDGKNYTMGKDAVLSLHYVGQEYLILSVMSEKEDLQLAITCLMKELKAGTYQVYACKDPSECPDGMDTQQQDVLFGPYIKDPMPPVSTSRTSYLAPKLGLQPLSLVITSVTDDQQAGNPWKTRRVKGHFEGKLAYVERKDADWQIIGKPTQLSGEMDMYCSIR